MKTIVDLITPSLVDEANFTRTIVTPAHTTIKYGAGVNWRATCVSTWTNVAQTSALSGVAQQKIWTTPASPFALTSVTLHLTTQLVSILTPTVVYFEVGLGTVYNTTSLLSVNTTKTFTSNTYPTNDVMFPVFWSSHGNPGNMTATDASGTGSHDAERADGMGTDTHFGDGDTVYFYGGGVLNSDVYLRLIDSSVGAWSITSGAFRIQFNGHFIT